MIQETEKASWRMRLKQKQRKYISRMSNGLNGQKVNILDSTTSAVETKVELYSSNSQIINLITHVCFLFSLMALMIMKCT